MPLIPGNIIFSAVAKYNDVVVSLDPLLTARLRLGDSECYYLLKTNARPLQDEQRTGVCSICAGKDV
jgi:hypothetical protein